MVGWAECPTLSTPGYVTETTEVAWAALGSAESLLEARDSGNIPALGAAMADAALDAELRARGIALVDHLGATRTRLQRTAVLARVGDDPMAIAAGAAAAIDAGAAMVKVKIAPGADVAVLHEVISAVGGSQRVAADANGTYTSAAELAAVDELGLAYLEQPFDAALGPAELAALVSELSTPIAADESVTSAASAREVLERRAAAIVSIKPARLGGVQAAAEVAGIAAERGAAAFVGGMFELGLGRAAAAAVAALSSVELPTDLGPSSAYVATDLCEPIVVDDDGLLVVPEGPGSGRTPSPGRLEEFAVARRRLIVS